jgi:hypothetical protein
MTFNIRNKYFPVKQPQLNKDDLNSYNTRVGKNRICDICKIRDAEEVHHLEPQKNSDEFGFIGTFHKNHGGNLVSICSKCHNEQHHGGGSATPEKKTKKRTSKGILLVNK